MERRYSARPYEGFFTGGGLHHFQNFEPEDNGRVLTVREALRRSVNLVCIRLMRDVVRHYMFNLPDSSTGFLEDPQDPVRQEYLTRFADREGAEYLQRPLPKAEHPPGGNRRPIHGLRAQPLQPDRPRLPGAGPSAVVMAGGNVRGPDAGNYKFTSGLTAQILKMLAPVLSPLTSQIGTPDPGRCDSLGRNPIVAAAP
ncbi:MAG: hypothetical protein AB1768_04820 [Pseudomonadota bacterium]|jgi:hypothetical protein